MFNRFQSRESQPAPVSSAPRKTNRSCTECTRRKVKCDGVQPVCGSCAYYKIPQACAYRQRTKRNAVSRSTLEEVSERLRARNDVLELLFPGASLDHLQGKTRSELLSIIENGPSPPKSASSASFQPPFPAGSGAADGSQPLQQQHQPPQPLTKYEEPEDLADDSAQVSENGEPADNDRQWEESTYNQSNPQAGDDISALSLATDKHRRSYLGITSINAILRSIFRLCPAARQNVTEGAKKLPSFAQMQQSVPSFLMNQQGPDPLKEQRCIDFYFEHIHPITGMLDEEEFRTAYFQGSRQDPSWLGLLNMVLALGSIASGSDVLHEQYYKQARAFVDLDTLGSGNLEGLQALTLLGGYYLHYRNSPNMAFAVLGAAHRVAIALGLHRESRRNSKMLNEPETPGRCSRAEIRRRTWWSLFCFDVWASMTLGRPTCGRWEDSTMDTHLPHAGPDDHIGLSLAASAQFCIIGNRIQNRYASFGRLTYQEALAFDQELQAWHANLPAIFQSPNNTLSRLNLAREFMRNRYNNVRLLLLRSLLIYLANGLARRGELTGEEQQLLERSKAAGCDAVNSIALHWTPNRFHIWNTGWYLFQACMVLLLSIAVERATGVDVDTSPAAPVRACVTKALEVFAEMRPWMRPDRFPDIVAMLYEAVTTEASGGESAASSQQRTPSGTDGDSNLFGWYDEQVNFNVDGVGNNMDWVIFVDEDDYQGHMFTSGQLMNQ